jgi:hypothetical protein
MASRESEAKQEIAISNFEEGDSYPYYERKFWNFTSLEKALGIGALLFGVLASIYASYVEERGYWVWISIFMLIFSVYVCSLVKEINDIGRKIYEIRFINTSRLLERVKNLEADVEHRRRLDEIDRLLGDKGEKFDRWEDIEDPENSLKVNIGFIPFNPTVVRGDSDHDVRGVGPEILARIFGSNCMNHYEICDWSNAFTRLARGDIDIIGTPMYDIKERRDYALFSMPLFYADMGLYCANPSSDSPMIQGLADELIDIPSGLFPDGEFRPEAFLWVREQLNSKDARKRILGSPDARYKLKIQENELNAKLVRRHFENVTECNSLPPGRSYEISSAISGLLHPSSTYHSHFVFCERAHAEKTPEFGSTAIVNLLSHAQLLFPVCFAIRKRDDTIRKYMNMKFLEIDSSSDEGIEGLIAEICGRVNNFDRPFSERVFRRSNFKA